jgi:hypothetical protein
MLGEGDHENQRACRNSKGETALALVPFSLHAPDAPLNHADQLSAAVSGLKVPEPTAPASRPSSRAHTSTEQEIQPAAEPKPRQRMHLRRKPGGDQVAPAALLGQARTPDEIAAVFRNFTEDHQRHRVKMWAALSDEELSAIEGLTVENQQRIKQVSAFGTLCMSSCVLKCRALTCMHCGQNCGRTLLLHRRPSPAPQEIQTAARPVQLEHASAAEA